MELRLCSGLLTSLFFFFIPMEAGAQPPPQSYPAYLKPAFSNVSYADKSKAQVFDLFLPNGNGPFPLVINIHGGAFKMGSKEMLDPPVAVAMLASGFAVATLNYRLSPEAGFPAAVLDVKAATRFLRANAQKFKLDPDRFLAFGQSAGGNLASMLGTTGDVSAFDDPALGNENVSSHVQGVVDWFGPTDFALMDAHAKAQGCPASSQTHSTPDSPESLYLGSQLEMIPDRVRQANPVSYVRKDNPPFLLQKGDQDCMVAVGQSELLFKALRQSGVSAELIILKGAGHGDMGAPVPIFLSPENVVRVIDFMKTTLK